MRFATIFASAFLVVSGVVAVPYEYNNDILVARDYYFHARDTVAPVRRKLRPITQGDCNNGQSRRTTAHECDDLHGHGFLYAPHSLSPPRCFTVNQELLYSIPENAEGDCWIG
ncbi:hypothetical protein AX17_004110 [Amanita inopinata Kibby_2008]|nr:hypothetical protein AX17_004110 [Amanita inopinata Kibby_2008]